MSGTGEPRHLRDAGGRADGRSCSLRWLVFGAAGLVPGVGSVLTAVSPSFGSSGLRQVCHDLAAGTRVVDVRPQQGGRAPTG